MADSRANPTRWPVALLAILAAGCVVPLSSPSTSASDAAADVASPDAGVVPPDTGLPADAPGGSDALPTPAGWTNVTSNLANLSSECGNMASVFVKPDEDLLIAGVARLGLWGSRDGGGSWQPMTADAGAGNIINRPSSLVFDPQNSMKFWESGIYNGQGVFVTADDGATFAPLGNVTSNDLVSVDFSDPNRQTLLAGGHETSQKLFRSIDGGMTWTNVGAGLPAGSYCTHPLIISGQVYLVGCAGGGGPSGVYTTTDAGGTWTQMTASGGSEAPLRASDSSIYWSSPNDRGLTRSTDNGLHWADTVGANVISSSHPIELPDGRLATISAPHTIVISSDHGVSWTPVPGGALPYSDAVGLVYSQPRKAFYTWRLTCGFNGPVPVPADAIMRFAFDYQKG